MRIVSFQRVNRSSIYIFFTLFYIYVFSVYDFYRGRM